MRANSAAIWPGRSPLGDLPAKRARRASFAGEHGRQPPQLGGALARGDGERLVVGFQAALEPRRGHAGLDRDRRQRVADEVVQLVCEAHPLGADGPRAEPLERVRDLGAAAVHLLLLGRDVAQEHAEHPVPEVDERRSDERQRRPVHGGIEPLGDHQPGDDEHEARGGAARAGRGRRDDERDDRREVRGAGRDRHLTRERAQDRRDADQRPRSRSARAERAAGAAPGWVRRRSPRGRRSSPSTAATSSSPQAIHSGESARPGGGRRRWHRLDGGRLAERADRGLHLAERVGRAGADGFQRVGRRAPRSTIPGSASSTGSIRCSSTLHVRSCSAVAASPGPRSSAATSRSRSARISPRRRWRRCSITPVAMPAPNNAQSA